MDDLVQMNAQITLDVFKPTIDYIAIWVFALLTWSICGLLLSKWFK